ncbi:MAG: hypothetical protein LBV12_04015 [Puniceicoccales bacterium]|nr:hypothetical protein [Puniceicoccales bacterium]
MLWEKELLKENILTIKSVKEINDAAQDESLAAVKFAEISNEPKTESITQDIYWEEDNKKEVANSKGKIIFD